MFGFFFLSRGGNKEYVTFVITGNSKQKTETYKLTWAWKQNCPYREALMDCRTCHQSQHVFLVRLCLSFCYRFPSYLVLWMCSLIGIICFFLPPESLEYLIYESRDPDMSLTPVGRERTRTTLYSRKPELDCRSFIPPLMLAISRTEQRNRFSISSAFQFP